MLLTKAEANEIFGECTCIDGDYSLAALLRALAISKSEYTIESITLESTCDRVRARSASDMLLYVHPANKAAVTVVECVDCINEEISAEKWRTFDEKPYPINSYLSQISKTRVYVNDESKKVVAFVERRASHHWVQAFESVLFRIMPWYFPNELSQEDRDFFRAVSLKGKDASGDQIEAFISYVNNIGAKLNLRSMHLRKILTGVADKQRQELIKDIESEINYYARQIQDYVQSLEGYYKSYDANVLKLNGLRNQPAQNDDALIEFFEQHKNVTVLRTSESGIRFGVEGTLDFYDEDEFFDLHENEYSYLNDYEEDVVRAIYNIFGQHKGVIRTNAVFELKQMKLVTPLKGESFVTDSMPNPHIYFYACSGGNDLYYKQFAQNGEWELAIEQAISATKNLCWGDSTVCSRMIRWLKEHDDIPCIYFNDGAPIDRVVDGMRLLTFREFIEASES